MSDPTDQLSTFDSGPAMHPMRASDVRRRGDRLRRRRNALAGVGAVAVVAAIATPFAVLGGEEERSFAPATQWVQQIPDDVDLTVDMPENESGEPVTQSAEDEGVGTVDFCGSTALPAGGPADRVATSASGPEYGESRELRLYPDEAAAAAALSNFKLVVAACPSEEYSGTTWVHREAPLGPSSLGPESLVATRTYEVAGEPVLGATFWQLVQVGNGLLVTSTGAEFGPDLAEPIASHTDQIAPVVESMCVFAAGGCGGDPDPR